MCYRILPLGSAWWSVPGGLPVWYRRPELPCRQTLLCRTDVYDWPTSCCCARCCWEMQKCWDQGSLFLGWKLPHFIPVEIKGFPDFVYCCNVSGWSNCSRFNYITPGLISKLNTNGCVLMNWKMSETPTLGHWQVLRPWCPIACDLAQGVFCMCHSTKIRGKHGLEMELDPLAQD